MVFWNYETFIMIWYYSTEDHKIKHFAQRVLSLWQMFPKNVASPPESKNSHPLSPSSSFWEILPPPPHASPPFSTLFFLEQKSLFFDLLMSVIKSYKTLDFSKHAPHIMTLHTWKQSQIYYNKVYHIHMSL